MAAVPVLAARQYQSSVVEYGYGITVLFFSDYEMAGCRQGYL